MRYADTKSCEATNTCTKGIMKQTNFVRRVTRFLAIIVVFISILCFFLSEPCVFEKLYRFFKSTLRSVRTWETVKNNYGPYSRRNIWKSRQEAQLSTIIEGECICAPSHLEVKNALVYFSYGWPRNNRFWKCWHLARNVERAHHELAHNLL